MKGGFAAEADLRYVQGVRFVARWLLVAELVASAAHAQLSVAGPPVSPPPAMGTAPVRWPDVAFDSTNSVWLAVSGATNIQGQYFAADGAVLGAAFTVNTDTVYAQCARVAFSPQAGAFLVTWHATINGGATRVRGRLLRHGQPALTQDIDISPEGTNWEMGAAIAYAVGSQEFLVVWQGAGATIVAQRVSLAGAKLGTPIEIDAAAPYKRDPSVGYEPVSDSYLIAYAGCVGMDDCFARAQRVKAGTGALIGTPLTLDSSINAGYVPEIAYNTQTQRWLVVWYRATPGARSLEGSTVAADGTVGPRQTVSATYASYDANSVAFGPVSGTFVVVTHATDQDIAIELDGSGRPLAPPGLLWGPTPVTGNFNPRIAARSGAPDFLGVTSTMFANLSAQRLTSASRSSVDAGSGDAGTEPDAGTAPDAGATPDAGSSSDGGSTPRPDGGTNGSATSSCGCGEGPWGPLLLAVLAVLRRGRGRARPRR